MTRPLLGGVLIVSGALAAAAAFLTWETAGGGATLLTGIEESDGWVSFWLGLVLAAAGLVVVSRRGRTWPWMAAVVVSGALAVVFRLDENGIHDSTEPGATIGAGLWLVGVAALAGVAASLAGFALVYRSRPATRRT